jgi:hypothetical protein
MGFGDIDWQSALPKLGLSLLASSLAFVLVLRPVYRATRDWLRDATLVNEVTGESVDRPVMQIVSALPDTEETASAASVEAGNRSIPAGNGTAGNGKVVVDTSLR